MAMTNRAELVSQLRATLTHGLTSKRARKVLRSLEDELLVPHGLYLNGGLNHSGDGSKFSPEIAGFVTRADGSDITERDRKKVEAWLAATPDITEFSMGTLQPADSPQFLPTGRAEGE